MSSARVREVQSMQRSDRSVYRRFVPLLKAYRGRLALGLAAGVVGPLLIAARIWLLKVLIDTVLNGHRPNLLPVVAGAFVAIAVVRGVIMCVSTHASGWWAHESCTTCARRCTPRFSIARCPISTRSD